MSRGIWIIVLTLVIAISEFTFAKYIAIGAAVPMLTFCYVILGSMHEKNRENALLLGVLSGALCDLLGGHGFGTYTVVFGVTAWETALFCDSILSSRFLFLIINTFIMTIFAESVYFLLHIIEIGAGAFWQGFGEIIIMTAIYNVVVSAILYKPMKKIFSERR